MKKEYTLVFIIGLFLLSYVLEAVVNPLDVQLATPYHYIDPKYLLKYPFTTATIAIRALGMFLTPLWLMSFFEGHYGGKSATTLALAALMQLYALQEVTTGDSIIPLEWSLSLSIAGAVLLLPMLSFLFIGGLSTAHKKIMGSGTDDDEDDDIDVSESSDEDSDSELIPSKD